jgi:hypothetical protein
VNRKQPYCRRLANNSGKRQATDQLLINALTGN